MKTKTCGRCGEIKLFDQFNKSKYTKSGLRSQCKDCMKKERERLRDHYKDWREKPEVKEWYREYRKARYRDGSCRNKQKARNAAQKLTRQPCEICGAEKVHAHHDDYTKPLDVRWLCAAHHRQWHTENGEGKNP